MGGAAMFHNTKDKKDRNEPSKTFDEAISTVIAAITHSDADTIYGELTPRRNPDCYEKTAPSHAMDQFRKDCDDYGEFTAEDILNAYRALDDCPELRFDQYNLIFIQVIGYMLRTAPQWLRDNLMQGIYFDVVEMKTKIKPEINDTNDYTVNGVTYPRERLGFDYSCDCFGPTTHIRVGAISKNLLCLKTLIRVKLNQDALELADSSRPGIVKPSV